MAKKASRNVAVPKINKPAEATAHQRPERGQCPCSASALRRRQSHSALIPMASTMTAVIRSPPRNTRLCGWSEAESSER